MLCAGSHAFPFLVSILKNFLPGKPKTISQKAQPQRKKALYHDTIHHFTFQGGRPHAVGNLLNRRLLFDIAKLAVVALVFVLLYKTGKIDFDTLRLATARPGLVLMAFVLVFCSTIFTVERWRRLLWAVDVHIGFGSAFSLTLIGIFFSVALPGAVGGDVVKAYYLAKGQSQRAALVATVIFDRLLGLYTMILMAMLAGAVMWGYVFLSGVHPEWWGGGVQALLAFIFALFISFTVGGALFMSDTMSRTRFMRKVMEVAPFREKVEKIYSAARRFGDNPILAFTAFGISFFGQIFLYSAIWILAMALELNELTVAQFLFVIPVCILINAIPAAPGGLGVGEVGFGAVFAMFGSGKGVELAVMYHAVSITIAVGLGGVIYLAHSRREGGMVTLKRLEDEREEDSV
jgi:hypothetical protein